ncbi:hypothetical protein D7Y13_23430 [Corallococcus praedator]|uniref:Uncharacterized protein n=1 Tax=Corallococcus praedator TaxID=2316724 RepID=A0ABX9QE34_9BACT|nr:MULTISPECIES: hypothetical protein [Corallococcus]RKH12224.1 hypothetical protein D7X74_24035 [Corallococcus sp. CA047B]RKH25625.1 hypothetical protein D7X75_29710 [Corallococcus sp. CA031C]RKI02917.1 hypothetical protein D7Y13_23430 [Corallococcus praedator]
MKFTEQLKVTLDLKAGDTAFTLPAGSIKRLSVKAWSHGFEAQVEWWVLCKESGDEDTLFTPFTATQPLTATLTVDRRYGAQAEGREGAEALPLKLIGRVEERHVRERSLANVKDAPVMQRRYRIRLVDPAAMLWRRHFPSGVWVDQSLQAVIQANTPGGLDVAYQWTAAETAHPLHALGLGADSDCGASFLDFLHWVQARMHAGVFLDYEKGKYTLADAKPEGGEAMVLTRDEVKQVDLRYPEPRRDALSVLNSYVDAGTKRKAVENADAIAGVLSECLLTSTLEGTLTDRVTLETKRQKLEGPEVRLAFACYPRVALVLNGLYTLGDGFSQQAATHGKQYRMHTLELDARSVEPDAAHDPDGTANDYRLSLKATLEEAADPTFRRPRFRPPRWPFFAEGRVVSEEGAEADRTYQIRQDDETSVESYRVKLPLWGKEVRVPYEPHQQPGHFYFPADKGTRVLVSLGYQHARMDRFLEWRPGARLPKESQGNHLLLGKTDKSETSIQHLYKDSKPVLRIQRTLEKDTQLIEVGEGRMYLRVQEGE